MKALPPGSGSEGAAGVPASAHTVADAGASAAAVAMRDIEQATDGDSSGRSVGDGLVGNSREGGVLGGDPEVTVSAAPDV